MAQACAEHGAACRRRSARPWRRWLRDAKEPGLADSLWKEEMGGSEGQPQTTTAEPNCRRMVMMMMLMMMMPSFCSIKSTEVNEERTNISESVMLMWSSKFDHMALARFVIEGFPQGFMR